MQFPITSSVGRRILFEVVQPHFEASLEIVRQVPDLEAVIIPIGGAGLAAGVALAVKHLKPEVTLIGVEPRRAAKINPIAALHEG